MRFYYDDGSVFEGEWQDAPGWGVQVIHWDGKVRHQGDFYRLEDGEPVAMDLFSLLHYVVNELGLVKVGYMQSHDRYDEIYQRAKRGD